MRSLAMAMTIHSCRRSARTQPRGAVDAPGARPLSPTAVRAEAARESPSRPGGSGLRAEATAARDTESRRPARWTGHGDPSPAPASARCSPTPPAPVRPHGRPRGPGAGTPTTPHRAPAAAPRAVGALAPAGEHRRRRERRGGKARAPATRSVQAPAGTRQARGPGARRPAARARRRRHRGGGAGRPVRESSDAPQRGGRSRRPRGRPGASQVSRKPDASTPAAAREERVDLGRR